MQYILYIIYTHRLYIAYSMEAFVGKAGQTCCPRSRKIAALLTSGGAKRSYNFSPKTDVRKHFQET